MDALYPFQYQRIRLKAPHRLVGFHSAAGQQVVEVVPVEAAARLQLHERHVRLARHIEQGSRIAQSLRAAGIHLAEELGGRPQADVRGEVVALHVGAVAQGAVMAAGIAGVFLGQQGVEDGAVHGVRLRLRPLLQLWQAGVEAVRRQLLLVGRAANVCLQHLRGVALLQAFPVDLAGQLDDGFRQAFLLRLLHLFPQVIIRLCVQAASHARQHQQQPAAQSSQYIHNSSIDWFHIIGKVTTFACKKMSFSY